MEKERGKETVVATAVVAAVAAAVNDEKKRATTFLSGSDTFTRKLRHCPFHGIPRIPSKSINHLPDQNFHRSTARLRGYQVTLDAEFARIITTRLHYHLIKLSLISSLLLSLSRVC